MTVGAIAPGWAWTTLRTWKRAVSYRSFSECSPLTATRASGTEAMGSKGSMSGGCVPGGSLRSTDITSDAHCEIAESRLIDELKKFRVMLTPTMDFDSWRSIPIAWPV